MSHAFRLNQMVCRVSWENGIPFIETCRVVKVTSKSYYVSESKKAANGWFDSWKKAINSEFIDLFRMWDEPWFPAAKKRRPDDWTIEDSIRAISKLRRLQKRIKRRAKKTEPTP